MRIHEIIFGFMVMALILSGLMIFFSTGNARYTITAYDNDSFDRVQGGFNETGELIVNAKNNITSISGGSSDDLLGSFFSSGYSSIKIIGGSIDIMKDSVNLVDKLELGEFGGMLKFTLVAGLLLAFIGTLIYVITKVPA